MVNPSDNFPEKISNLLQSNWSAGTGLVVSDIAWSHDKFETMNSVETVSQKAIISTYNPTNPVVVEHLSRETALVRETIVVDIILHTAAFSSTDATIGVREAIRAQILKVIHANWNLLSGADQMVVEGEYLRGELPQIQREAFKVVVSNFEVLPL